MLVDPAEFRIARHPFQNFRFYCAAAVILAGSASPVAGAAGQSYPERPVRIFVGLAAGGGTDSVARIMAQKLSDVFGQSFVVDNRPGAGGNVAGELTARAAPDGYTLIAVTPTHIINPSIYRDVRYDAIKDFAPIGLIAYAQYYLSAANAVPAATLKDLIALAKTQRLMYGSPGIGGTNHLAGELFKSMAGIEMVHVPYKGGAPTLNALISGEVHVSFTSGVVLPHAKAGRLKTLAVTGGKRTPLAPDIPTVAEAGLPGYEVTGWYGLAAPARTPKAILEHLNVTMNRVLPELQDRYASLAMDLAGGTASQFGSLLTSEREKWARVVRLSGVKPE
ncbi:MAG TPA: tripartite tricarboxylate transporter substrate binding protein [Burkholderiales bacterium]|nr:tripartite tricarboxylate transporter substrate binding protein [Burkholderiales bacterium]